MLRQRILVSVVLLPIGLALVYVGGLAYIVLIALILGLAAWEYAQLFRAGSFQPNGILVVVGTVALALGRGINGFESADWILGLFVLASMLFHLLTYEREREAAGTDFAITLSGALYIGWLGAYLISLRTLPNGLWWFLVALPSVWIADSGAYFIGRQFGRHRLCPRLSPKKTWEGYIGGIISGVLGGALLAALVPNVDITPMRGVVLGLILSVITPLGDLGESMFKRQVNIKDSSNLIPGHGGAFDRVDSWLWGGIISYYIITWLFI